MLDGTIISKGDTDKQFCLQSCAKPLTYCLARELSDLKKVHQHVGYEPSGRAFNSFCLNNDNLPHNPLINAGAIMTTALIENDKEPADRFECIKDFYQNMSGNTGMIGFDNSVFLSEKHHADRNTSLAYYMKENKAFPEGFSPTDIQRTLDLYFQTCSITLDCKTASIICGTLANGGYCPINNQKVVEPTIVRDCLSLMYMCGMYDYSGQFAFEVGLPAKSGVSGCIFLVIPKKMGICIWSPRLDKNGNSIRGVEFSKQLIRKYPSKFHIFYNLMSDRNDEDISKANLSYIIINACSEGNIELLQKYLDDKNSGGDAIDLNKGDYDRRTPLHLASAEGHLDIVKYLLGKGVDTNPKDRWGNTPSHEASKGQSKNHSEICNLLEKMRESD